MRLSFITFSLLFPFLLCAQAPQAFDFQGVARDALGNVLSEQSIALRLSVIADQPDGPVSYRETHAVTTSAFGLFTVAVGQGTVQLGTFDAVGWASGPRFLKVEMDASGGNAFVDLGTTQLLSVPYALYAESSGTGSGGGTLDDAYRSGGAGQGRIITADGGAVLIENTNSTSAIQLTSSVPNSTAVRADHAGTGVAMRAENSDPANGFAAVQAVTNSADPDNSAILGNNDGAGYAVAGQIPATATGTAAVYGSNLRTTGGSGVSGIGFNGVVGQAQGPDGFGLFGQNPSSDGSALGIGTYGIGFHGVYGQTTNTSLGWAGYFTADLGVDGTGYALGGWVNASDRRLKDDIRPIQGALDKVRLLEGSHYTLRTKSRDTEGIVQEQTRQQYGLIAQEVESIFPELVGEKALFIHSGDDTLYKTVDYIQLVPVLIEAVKELATEVQQLRDELELLRR